MANKLHIKSFIVGLACGSLLFSAEAVVRTATVGLLDNLKYADFDALGVAFQKGELDNHYFVQIDSEGTECRLRYWNSTVKDVTNDTRNAICRTLFRYQRPDPQIEQELVSRNIPYKRSR